MFCPRAFVETIRKPFGFNVCVHITRSHPTSRYIRVGLACVQGMNSYQIIPYHAGHRSPYIAIDFLRSLIYISSNTSEHQLAAQQRLARFIELQSAQFLINGRVMGRLLFKGARPGVKKYLYGPMRRGHGTGGYIAASLMHLGFSLVLLLLLLLLLLVPSPAHP